MPVRRVHTSAVFNLDVLSKATLPSSIFNDSIGSGYDRRAGRGSIINAEVWAADPSNGMKTTPGESGADPFITVLEGGFQKGFSHKNL